MLASATNLPGGDAVARYVRTPGSPTNAPWRRARTIAGPGPINRTGLACGRTVGDELPSELEGIQVNGLFAIRGPQASQLDDLFDVAPREVAVEFDYLGDLVVGVSAENGDTRSPGFALRIGKNASTNCRWGAPRGTDNPPPH